VKVVKSTVAVSLWAVLGFVALYFNYSADRMGGVLIQNQIIADKANSTPIVSSRNTIAQTTLAEAEKEKEKRIANAEKALNEAKANKSAALLALMGKDLSKLYASGNDWGLQKAKEVYGAKPAELDALHDAKIALAQVFLDSTTQQMNALVMSKTATLVGETNQTHKESQDYNDAIASFSGNFSIGALLLIILLVCLMKLEGYPIYVTKKKGKASPQVAHAVPHHPSSTSTHHAQSAQGYPKR
jgi:hypothetical protein